MKNKLIYISLFILILILLITVLFITFRQDAHSSRIEAENGLVKVEFMDNAILEAEVADDDNERGKGLMYRGSLGRNKGMIFIYEGEHVLDFWMKNTLIPLDIIFVDKENNIVNLIRGMTPCRQEPCAIYSSEFPAKYAIEVNFGYIDDNNIKIGQKVKFLNLVSNLK